MVSAPDLQAGAPLQRATWRALRRELVFRHHKLDPQFQDHDAAASFPVWLSRAAWAELAGRSEALAAETLALETAALARPDTWRDLGLPWAIRAALRARPTRQSGAVTRVMRFDWHPTPDGWRVSEVNADVPGGYIEATGLTRLMAEACGGAATGDPTAAVAAAVADARDIDASARAPVALVHATAYTDDRQVMMYLGDALAHLGAPAALCSPLDLRWDDGVATLDGKPTSAILRFFPAEWLTELPLASRWWRWFGPARTPSCNPTTALLTQSKRLPLLWETLGVDVPAWRAAAPSTHPASAWRSDGSSVLKPTWGRVGAGVTVAGLTPNTAERAALREARRWPRAWVSQDRFLSQPIDSPLGPRHVVLGVYTVDGRACGVYGRCSGDAIITGAAQDVAVLLPPERA